VGQVDDDLSQLERDIRTLKIEFEQYFGGGRPRPPSDTQWRIDQMVKRYSERAGAEMNYGQRFRFNNLTQTYAKYMDMFRKRMKAKEEGFVQRHYGSAAKQIEADRAARGVSPTGAPAAAGSGSARRGGEYVMATSDPDRETDKVQDLYRALVEAKKNAGESTDALTLDNFREFVRLKTQQLKKQKGTDQVEYTVSIENGQVKLKARVK
jgi:hypothetical protein